MQNSLIYTQQDAKYYAVFLFLQTDIAPMRDSRSRQQKLKSKKTNGEEKEKNTKKKIDKKIGKNKR